MNRCQDITPKAWAGVLRTMRWRAASAISKTTVRKARHAALNPVVWGSGGPNWLGFRLNATAEASPNRTAATINVTESCSDPEWATKPKISPRVAPNTADTPPSVGDNEFAVSNRCGGTTRGNPADNAANKNRLMLKVSNANT